MIVHLNCVDYIVYRCHAKVHLKFTDLISKSYNKSDSAWYGLIKSEHSSHGAVRLFTQINE